MGDHADNNLFDTDTHNLSSTIETIHVDVSAIVREQHADGVSNNSPGVPLALSNLDIDNHVTARLTQKPEKKYKFRKSIGRGGMKMVLQVKDMDTMRDVAMAVLPDASSRPRQDILRFVQEARITASLEHPNIVPVHEIGVDASGSPYFTMKLLRGDNLGTVLENLQAGIPEYVESYNLTRLLRVFLKVCYAVAFAHSKGILHLDLKPENIQIGDFGEVLVMDWGLAKIIDPSKQGDLQDASIPEPADEGSKAENAADKPGRSDSSLTVDGIMKGTPGYMAPEQAAGQNSRKDNRTDIYALGAILYAMSTLRNPIERKPIKEMVRDTLSGNIIPPRRRAPERDIPSALEAVIQKAMSLNPDDRYNSVQELRGEVYAFIGGYATKAERATRFKKTLLLAKRHRLVCTAAAVVLLVLLGAASYAFQETMRQKASWTTFYEQDFTKSGAPLNDLLFYNSTISEPTPAWEAGADGLRMPFGEWVWIDKHIVGGVKLEIEYTTGDMIDAIEVCLSSRMEPLQRWWYVPTGFSFQFAGFSGTRDLIFMNSAAQSPEMIMAVDSKAKAGRLNKVTFMKKEERLSVSANGYSSYLEASDLFPPSGKNLDMIGIRSFSTSARLRSIKASRLALPEKASPLIAGDALLEEQLYDQAVRRYLAVADSYANLPLADTALVKAYMTVVSKLPHSKNRSDLILEIKKKIADKASFKFKEQIMEIDSISMWRDQRWQESLVLLRDIFKLNPNTSIISRILQVPHQPLPDPVANELMDLIASTKNLKQLDISNYGIPSLVPLKNLPLTYLDCSGNGLASLDGVQTMPLESLSCYGNKISNLAPLAGKKLKSLSCQSNLIEDLSPLRNLPLRDLNIANNQVSSLAPLTSALLDNFSCRSNEVADLAPLASLPLKKLDIGENPVLSIEPLRNLPLSSLHADCTLISDLSPLDGMPLQILELTNCKNLKNLSTLFNMPFLERLSIPRETADIEPLRMLPNLKYLSCESISPFAVQNVQTAEDFWKEHDKK